MLTQKDQKNLRSKLDKIYKILLSKREIDYFLSEIVRIIKNFNKKIISRGPILVTQWKSFDIL